ncbi:hypothetical protein MVEN_00868400 [Mycena venus]|uniref:Uncharacterized protein n=1 Tax=Mycena venus TaxID=2733690 RepID=A0A8H6YFT4_9AGAR|nr:hypothetical protein MVEN_00868400 [Mycena venus]
MQSLHPFAKFVLLAVLCASSVRAGSWICQCTTNGVVSAGASSSCCSGAGGTFNRFVNSCGDLSDNGTGEGNQGQSGEFIQCCLNSGQGAGCQPA